MKNLKKEKKAFTLIELLAVIIILGVLMIIAIPAVTKYINESRENGYISTAKNIANGVRNLIHNGDFNLNDKNTTYYIDGKCISTDNGYKSPYGNITKSYVAVVLNKDNYDYYWMSVDETGKGIKSLKNVNDLENNDIESDIAIEDIAPNIGIDKRNTIVKIEGENCIVSDPVEATRRMNSKTGNVKGPCPAITPTIYWALQNPDSNNNYQKLVISDSPVSGGESGSFSSSTTFTAYTQVPWTSTTDRTMYVKDIEIVGTVAPKRTGYWFYNLGYNVDTLDIDLSNLEVCNVVDTNNMFSFFGRNAHNLNLDLRDWDTSNVTRMNTMFYSMGYNTTKLNLDINNFDTSKVTSMSYMFTYFGQNSREVNLGIDEWDTSNVTSMSYMFFLGMQKADNLKLDLSKWNTSKVTNMHRMFAYVGNYSTSLDLNIGNFNTSLVDTIDDIFLYSGTVATRFNVIIPRTNGNGISNTIDTIYGSNSEEYYTLPAGKEFTLAG